MVFRTGPFNVVPFTNTTSPIIPADRTTLWQPGVTYNKIPASAGGTGAFGIPHRTTIFTTLSPAGGGTDDGAIITSAMNSCPAGQVVLLTTGVFNINTNINYRGSGQITLRGSGTGNGSANFGVSPVSGPLVFNSDSSATQLLFTNANTSPVVVMNGYDFKPITTYNLAADAIQGTYTCQLTSDAGLVAGQIVRIDQYTSQAAVATINAASSFTTASTTITMSSSNPGSVLPGMWVGDATTQQTIGYVLSYSGTTLTLVSASAISSSGSSDSIEFATYPWQANDPDVYWGPNHQGVGSATRAFFNRGDRTWCQIMEVASYNSSTFVATFTTPFHHNLCAGSGSSPSPYWPGQFVYGGQAQLCVYTGASPTGPLMYAMGLEDLVVANGVQNGSGNIYMGGCAYSWVKHVESYWSNGASILMASCFRCEVRDSFMHETPSPAPGGGGYLADLQWGSSDCLYENNIMWSGNKQIVGQCTGGGNVIAYNYMDDAFGKDSPNLPESGINSAHMVGSNMDLMEGNYSHKYSGDSFWGNIVTMTVFRNWLSDIRAAHPPLNTYTTDNHGGGVYPYIDDGTRTPMDIQTSCYRGNYVGNVLGKSGQTLLSYSNPGWSFAQTSFAYEDLTTLGTGAVVNMWYIGQIQGANGLNTWDPTTYQTQLRQGNWDWFTSTQVWYSGTGIGTTGSTSTGPSKTMPSSMYLSSTPSFFLSNSYSANTWPWVDPSTGTCYSLPAKARFDAGTPSLL